MKNVLLVVLLAAAASAVIVSNEVLDMVELPDVDEVPDLEEVPDLDELADGDNKDFPEIFVTDEDELVDEAELPDEAEDPSATAVAPRRNLNQGSIGARDLRVLNRQYRANCLPGRIRERIIRINSNRRISAIRVNRVGASQRATPSIRSGGIGKTSVTIRIRSAKGRGYDYRVRVYVRK